MRIVSKFHPIIKTFLDFLHGEEWQCFWVESCRRLSNTPYLLGVVCRVNSFGWYKSREKNIQGVIIVKFWVIGGDAVEIAHLILLVYQSIGYVGGLDQCW